MVVGFFVCFIYIKQMIYKNIKNDRKSDNCQNKTANKPETGILAVELTGSYGQSQFFFH